jgi:transposase
MVDHGVPRYTVKKVYNFHAARVSDATLDARIDYVNRYLQLRSTGAEFIFIDESAWNNFDYRDRGRAPVGERAVDASRRRPRPPQHITAITAISSRRGVVHVTFVVGPVNELVFSAFLANLFTQLRSVRAGSCRIVMDNVGFHNTDGVRTLISDSGHVHLSTVPNSCELNPIEYVFHAWKSRVSIPPEVNTTAEVVRCLDRAFVSLEPEIVHSCIFYVEQVMFTKARQREQLVLSRAVSGIRSCGAPLPELVDAELDAGIIEPESPLGSVDPGQ